MEKRPDPETQCARRKEESGTAKGEAEMVQQRVYVLAFYDDRSSISQNMKYQSRETCKKKTLQQSTT